jgi:hypothetical protein
LWIVLLLGLPEALTLLVGSHESTKIVVVSFRPRGACFDGLEKTIVYGKSSSKKVLISVTYKL